MHGKDNFGYGTKAHLDGLKKFGLTVHHRKGFKPVHKILSRLESQHKKIHFFIK